MQLALWLRQASKNSLSAPSASFFGSSGKKQVGKDFEFEVDILYVCSADVDVFVGNCVASSVDPSERD